MLLINNSLPRSLTSLDNSEPFNEKDNQNKERLRISRDLHDGLAQEIAAIGYQLDALIGRNDLTHEPRQHLRRIRGQVSELSLRARTEIYQLRKSIQQSPTIAVTESLAAIAAKRGRTVIVAGELPAENSDILQAVIEELVENFCRHETSLTCTVELSPELIRIFPITASEVNFNSERLGLRGANERLHEISWEFFTAATAIGIRPQFLP